jgi:hypothetical protein
MNRLRSRPFVPCEDEQLDFINKKLKFEWNDAVYTSLWSLNFYVIKINWTDGHWILGLGISYCIARRSPAELTVPLCLWGPSSADTAISSFCTCPLRCNQPAYPNNYFAF